MLGKPQKLSSAQHTGTLWQSDHVSFHVCFAKLFVENTLNTLKYKTNTCLCKVWCESSGRLNRRAAAIPKPIFYLTNFRRTGQSGRTSWKLENRAFPDAVEFGNRTAHPRNRSILMSSFVHFSSQQLRGMTGEQPYMR